MEEEEGSEGVVLEIGGGAESPPAAPMARAKRSKRVVCVAIKDEGKYSRSDDCWGWRKYGQNSIHGSRNPRGYYNCRSKHSKGCKALKQVEKSHQDPSFLIITYFYQHNHPPPPSPTTPPSTSKTESRSNPFNQSQMEADDTTSTSSITCMKTTSSTIMESLTRSS